MTYTLSYTKVFTDGPLLGLSYPTQVTGNDFARLQAFVDKKHIPAHPQLGPGFRIVNPVITAHYTT